jgi:catechol 2,3-dioxygenase-like lactoylglutathione lyase family enzyme
MSVVGLDHLAITVADLEKTVEFYCRVLGAEDVYADLWRSGKIPVAILQLGASRLSVHSAGAPASPHADTPTPGSGDICFRWDGPISKASAWLSEQGVEVIEGPVPRPAADGRVGESIYFRDPDENLLEFLTTHVGDDA